MEQFSCQANFRVLVTACTHVQSGFRQSLLSICPSVYLLVSLSTPKNTSSTHTHMHMHTCTHTRTHTHTHTPAGSDRDGHMRLIMELSQQVSSLDAELRQAQETIQKLRREQQSHNGEWSSLSPSSGHSTASYTGRVSVGNSSEWQQTSTQVYQNKAHLSRTVHQLCCIRKLIQNTHQTGTHQATAIHKHAAQKLLPCILK